jgi:hypothetical protein
MSQRVLNLLDSNPQQSFFFAFGAGKSNLNLSSSLKINQKLISPKKYVIFSIKGHFLGNNSILDFVKENGFQVVRVSDFNVNKKNK